MKTSITSVYCSLVLEKRSIPVQLKNYQLMTVPEISRTCLRIISTVRRIRASFPTTNADPMNADQLYHVPELCEFSPTTSTEPSSRIRSMAKKSCSFDPIPGSLMTDCFSVLLPVFVNMINLSFKDGLVPALFKEAVLDPVFKRDSLDHDIYQNYRPILNLRFVSRQLCFHEQDYISLR